MIVHAVAVSELVKLTNGGRLRECRAMCGRKNLRFVVYFPANASAEVCDSCRALVPDLKVPEPGPIIYREIRRISSMPPSGR